MQKPIPPNAAVLSAPQDAALRQEEFGDLSQAADQFDTAREYYAVALAQVRPDDRATKARLLEDFERLRSAIAWHSSARHRDERSRSIFSVSERSAFWWICPVTATPRYREE